MADLNATLMNYTATLSTINDTLFGTTNGTANFNTFFGNLGQYEGTSDINAGFTLTSGYLVFFMQCGFAMLCAGSVRAKNAKNIILLNIMDACFGCVAWYATGWAFAFGDPASVDADGVAYNAAGDSIGNLQ